MKSACAIFLAVVAGVDRSVQALELENLLPKLPTVPGVQHPDKNGFPIMRSVQSVMEGFVKEKDSLNRDAAALGSHLKQVEKNDADRVTQQNSVYLKKLKEQEKQNQAVSVENAKVAQLIMKVRKGNDKLSSLVQKELFQVNLRRKQFAALKKTMLEGEERVNKLLEGGDTSAPLSFLEIVQEGARRKMLRDEVAEQTLDSESSELPASLLEATTAFDEQVQTQVEEEVANSPEEAQASSSGASLLELEKGTASQIDSLSKQVRKLNQETAHALAELKASFEESYKQGTKRHDALIKQQGVLKGSLKSAEEVFSKLKKKYRHLTDVHKGLDQELHKNDVSLQETQRMTTATLSDQA